MKTNLSPLFSLHGASATDLCWKHVTPFGGDFDILWVCQHASSLFKGTADWEKYEKARELKV